MAVQLADEKFGRELPVGYFGRAAIIHTVDTEEHGKFKLFVERSSDTAVLWTELTIFGADKLETRGLEAVAALLNCKLYNAFGRLEDMAQGREPVDGIEKSRGMFANAVNMQTRVTADSPFAFIDKHMAEQFKKFADAYGCEIVPLSYAH
jgi:hypothetical protein